jgi:hypothetical protein
MEGVFDARSSKIVEEKIGFLISTNYYFITDKTKGKQSYWRNRAFAIRCSTLFFPPPDHFD